MAAKQTAVVLTFAVLICSFAFIMYKDTSIQLTSVFGSHELASERKDRELMEFISQRNNISRLLNFKQQKIGQMECENITKGAAVSNTGGWCATKSVENGGGHITDRKIIPALAEIFTGKIVASFGDGPGRYKQLLLETGKLKSYDAFDGAPYSEKTSEGRVNFLDLTLPQYGIPVYDWIISLEVAEHIPKQHEHSFVDNIVRHAKEGVVLSWARPGQGGYSHVNNKPFEYVKKLFESLGFKHNKVESQKLKQAASLSWLKSNTNVFERVNINQEVETKLLQNA